MTEFLHFLIHDQLLYREGEVGIGERLVLQREVPPLSIERLEAMTEHCLTENHAVLELLESNEATCWRF